MKMKIKRLTIILILFKFVNSDERLVVTGADEPVSAHAGEDVTLSCSVDTHVNMTELEVEWRKTDGDIKVLLYTKGKIIPQHDRYSGRAELFTEEIPKGNFSMKLRKVRTEDKGEFRCEVNTDTDSNSTTARIAALGYSSWHWWILVLCIAVILILTGPFLLWKRESRQDVCCEQCRGQCCGQCHYQCCDQCCKKCRGQCCAQCCERCRDQCCDRCCKWRCKRCRTLCCERLLVAVPAGIVFIAFILWGVTEGSREEAVTCAAINLLYILVLFIMDPDRLYPGMSWTPRCLAQSTGVTIVIMTLCIINVIEFSMKHATTTAGKTALGFVVGAFVLLMVYMIFMQLFFFWIWKKVFNAVWTTLQKRLRTIIWILATVLIIVVLVTIGVGVFLAIYLSGKTETVQFIVIQLIIFSIPIFGLEFFFVSHREIPARQQYQLTCAFYNVLKSLNMMLNMQILTLYVQLIAWIQDTFLLGYFISIAILPLGICACFFAKIYLNELRHFYLVQKILLGVFFMLHLILSFLYLNLIPENNKDLTTERPVNMWEFVFIYILILISNADRYWKKNLDKPRKYLYFSGAFGLPLLNSVALAVVLILKADTGKQPLDLRLIALISGSVFLFGWLVIYMCAYCLNKKEKKTQDSSTWTGHQDSKSDQTHLTHPEKPKMMEEQLKSLNEVCKRQDLTMNMILTHMFHYKFGLSCQEEKCPLSFKSDGKNQSNNGPAVKRNHSSFVLHCPKPNQVPLTDQEKPKMMDLLKFLDEVCERKDQTMKMIMKHMFHHRAGKSWQEAECPLCDESDEMNQSHDGRAAKRKRSSTSTGLQDQEKPKMTVEDLKFLNEVSQREDQTMEIIVNHMIHCKAGLSCWEEKCPLPAMCASRNRSYSCTED